MFLLERIINLLENKNYALNLETGEYEQTTAKNEIYKKITNDIENIDRYFLSFTDLPYLQINFHNVYDTPTGIYNYPFKYYITREEVKKVSHNEKDGQIEFYKEIKMSIKKFPYVSDKDNVIVFKITKECLDHLWTRENFTKSDYEKNKEKLINMLLLNDDKTKKEVEELINEYKENKKEYDTIKPLYKSFSEFEKECRPKKHKFVYKGEEGGEQEVIQTEGVEDKLEVIKKSVLSNIDKINSNDNERIIREIKVLEQRYKKIKFNNDWYGDNIESEFYNDYTIILKVKTQLGILLSTLGSQLTDTQNKKTNITKFNDRLKKVLKGKNPNEFIKETLYDIEDTLVSSMDDSRVIGNLDDNYLGQFWFLVYQLCYKKFYNVLGLNPKKKDIYNDKNFDSTAEHAMSAIFLRLGCWGVLDDGTGFIHPNEKKQCVFFGSTKKFIEYQQPLYNDLNKDSKHYKDPKQQKKNKEIGKAYNVRDQLLHIKDFDFIMDQDNIFSSYNGKANIKEISKGTTTHKLSNYYFIQVKAKNKQFINCDISPFGQTTKYTTFNTCILQKCKLYSKIVSNDTTYNNSQFSYYAKSYLVDNSQFNTCTFNECKIINKYGMYSQCNINNSEILASGRFEKCNITKSNILDVSNENKPKFINCIFDNIMFDSNSNKSTTDINRNILKYFENCTFMNTDLSIILDVNIKSFDTFNDSFDILHINPLDNCIIDLVLIIDNIHFNVKEFKSNQLNHFTANMFDRDFYDNVINIIKSDEKYKGIELKKLFDEKLK